MWVKSSPAQLNLKHRYLTEEIIYKLLNYARRSALNDSETLSGLRQLLF